MSRQRRDSSPENPFQSPTDASEEYEVRGPGICPYCGESDFQRPYFTHWGGYVGPWLLSHAVCQRCQRGFNARSGASNLINIALYQISSIVLLIFAIIYAILFILPIWRVWL